MSLRLSACIIAASTGGIYVIYCHRVTTKLQLINIIIKCDIGDVYEYIAHLRQECHNSKFVIFQEKLLKGFEVL